MRVYSFLALFVCICIIFYYINTHSCELLSCLITKPWSRNWPKSYKRQWCIFLPLTPFVQNMTADNCTVSTCSKSSDIMILTRPLWLYSTDWINVKCNPRLRKCNKILILQHFRILGVFRTLWSNSVLLPIGYHY